MVKRMGGMRRKTRSKLRKSPEMKGKISITRYLQVLKTGDQVLLKIEPSVHKGMFYPRFHGKTGIIVDARGKCYDVEIQDGKKRKILVVHPVHMRRIEHGRA